MTTATLGIEVKSGSAKEGAVDLDRLAVSAGKADTAVTGLNAASNAEALSQGKATATAKMHTVALQAQALAARGVMLNSRQLSYQLIDIGQSIPQAFQSPLYFLQNLGFQFAQIGQLYMGQGGLKAALTDSIGMVGRFASRFAPLAVVVGGVAAAIAGMEHEIRQATGVQVTFGDTALAVWQTVRDGIYNILKPAIDAVSPWFSEAWNAVVVSTKAVGNYIIKSFEAAFILIKAAVMNLPDVFIVAGQAAAKGFVSAIVEMARTVTVILNGLINQINALAIKAGLSKQGAGGILPMLDLPKSPHIDFGGDAAMARLTASAMETKKQLDALANDDPLGRFYSTVQEHALQNAKDRLKDVGNAGKDAGKALSKAADDAAARWRAIKGQLDAVRENIVHTLDSIRSASKDILDAGVQAFRANGNIFDALRASAERLQDKLIDLAENQVIAMLLGGQGQAGGGIFGTLLGSLIGRSGPAVPAGLFHSGGVAGAATAHRYIHPAYFDNAPRYHRGGIAGLQPNEVPAILQRGERITPAGQSMGGTVNLNVHVHGARGNAEIEESVHAGITSALTAYDKHMPTKIMGTMAAIAKKNARLNR